MKTRRQQHRICEGPLGFPLRESVARTVEALLAARPKGEEWEYRRTSTAPFATELVEGERCDVSVISTPSLDRDREVVIATGIDLAQFRSNPVVTFAHRYDELPVGRALWIKHEGDRLKAKTRYTPRPADWKGDWLPDAIWHMVKTGDLNGKSIGFLPLDGGPPTPDEVSRFPQWKEAQWVYRKSLLLEYAVAPVQSNPDALVEAVSKGLLGVELAAKLGLGDTPRTMQSSAGPRFVAFAELSAAFEGALAVELAARNLPALAEGRIARRLGRV